MQIPIHLVISLPDLIVKTMTMMAQILIQMAMVSSNRFGIKESRDKVSCSLSSMTSIMTMTVSLMAKIGMMTMMAHPTSIRSYSASGVKSNPLGTMTTTVFSTGLTMIGMVTAEQISRKTLVSMH